MSRFGRLLGVWTVAIVAGWAVVILLGGPVTTAADELQTALNPPTPVTEAVARTSAATIVQLQYSDLVGFEPTVRHATDFGGDRWIVVYARPDPVAGVRVSIDTASGEVRVTTFP